MNRFLNILSIGGTFLVLFGLLFSAQELTLGSISFLRDTIICEVFRLKDLLFSATTLILIFSFIRFYYPRRSQN